VFGVVHVVLCVCGSDSANTVTSSVGYRHDNPALTEQRVAQILSEARAAMNAVDTPQTKVSPCTDLLQ